MVARALHLLGLELGPSLLVATADNPQGYWESPFFVQINAELLHTLKCDSDGFGSYDALTRLPVYVGPAEFGRRDLGSVYEFDGEFFSAFTSAF